MNSFRYWNHPEYGWYLLVAIIVASALLIGGIFAYAAIRRWANRPPDPVDDSVACIACGSTTDRWDLAPGVYACLCGYEGGPGMKAWQWQKRCDALLALSPDKQNAERISRLERARDGFGLAKNALDTANQYVVAGMQHDANPGLEQPVGHSYSLARKQLSAARDHLLASMVDLETAQFLAQGTDQRDDLRKRVHGGVGTLSGTGPDVALSLQNEENRLRELIADLDQIAAACTP